MPWKEEDALFYRKKRNSKEFFQFFCQAKIMSYRMKSGLPNTALSLGCIECQLFSHAVWIAVAV